MKYCLFYGSLKSKHYNFGRFAGQKLIKELTLPNFELYNLGAYPAACRGDGNMTCELQEVDDSSFNSIRRMEFGAGYKEIEVEVDGMKASMFIMDKQKLMRYNVPKVESGNW